MTTLLATDLADEEGDVVRFVGMEGERIKCVGEISG